MNSAPDHAIEAALAHHRAGRFDQARAIYEQILQSNPAQTNALHLLGLIEYQSQRLQRAADLIERAIARDPSSAAFHANLGEVYRAQGRHAEAVATCRKSLELGESPEAHGNLGVALEQSGQPQLAIEHFHHALRLDPKYADAYAHLGRVMYHLARYAEAIHFCQKALELRPDAHESMNVLGSSFAAVGKPIAAIEAYKRALSIAPNSALAWNNLANALRDIGEHDKSIAAHQRAISLSPNDPGLHGTLLHAMHYAKVNARELASAHRAWGQRFADPITAAAPPHKISRDKNRRLRIGYVSPDFRTHSVASFFKPILRHHDKAKFEIFCYANVAREDETTSRLKAVAEHWRDIFALSDARAAELIRQDDIEILIDLAGRTTGGRPMLFAHQPAPIQAGYLGYPNTMGMNAIAYRITDALADPDGDADQLYNEKLIRLPNTFLCFNPPRAELGARRPRDHITFGSFNRPTKLSEETLGMWCDVLRGVPSSRLLLKGIGFAEDAAKNLWRERFARLGIAVDRVEIIESVESLDEHLAMYSRIDIALDTFPYHGTTTTCEATWMGVPTITLAGDAHVSRVGASLLTCVGLPGLIANSQDEFVNIAAKLAGDLPRLSDLHRTLRDRMQASPLVDGDQFVRNLEDAYRRMWRELI